MTDLTQKAISQTIFFILFIALFIFIPAWSLNYWQGWVLWANFSVWILGITLYFLKHDPELIKRRLDAGPTAEKEKSQKIIQSILSVVLILLFVVSGLDYHFGWTHVRGVGILVANILIMLGFYIVFLTFKVNTFTSATIGVHDKQKVVSTGVYGVVRHPMYAGAAILLLATPIAFGVWSTLIFSIVMVVGMGWRAIEEEKLLTTNLPGYAEYIQKVKYRFIPLIW